MEPKPLLFPILYDVQEASELMSESTSIYEAPIMRERVQESDEESVTFNRSIVQQAESKEKKVRSIALRNRQLVQGIVLRNECAKLLVETKDGPIWIAKSQIVQIYD